MSAVINLRKNKFYNNYKNTIFSKNIIIFLTVISIWLSIDTSFVDLLYSDYKTIKKYIIVARVILPFIFFILLIIFFLHLNKINYKNFFIICSFLMFLFQTLGFLFSKNSILNISYAFNCLMFLSILTVFCEDKKILLKIFYLGLLILLSIFLIYGGYLFFWFYFKSTNLNLYGSWPASLEQLQFLSNTLPRSSGLARNSMIFLIISSILLLFIKNYKKKLSILIILFILFCTLIIYLTQSRIIIIFYILYFTLYFYSLFFLNNFKIKNKIYTLIIIFLIPLCCWSISIVYKNNLLNFFYTDEEIKNIIIKYGSDYEKPLRTIDKKTITSNRFNDWKKIINQNDNVLIGHGSMGDRYLINQTASNYFIYLYSSSGLIGLFCGIIIYLFALFLVLKHLIDSKLKITKKNKLNFITSAIISLFLLRGITETSFSNFGIDFLIFFSAIYIQLKVQNDNFFYKKNLNNFIDKITRFKKILGA